MRTCGNTDERTGKNTGSMKLTDGNTRPSRSEQKGRHRMKKIQLKAAAVLIISLVVVIFSLTGCVRHKDRVTTLYDTNTLKIERVGTQTNIYDKAAGAKYSFARSKAHRSEAAGKPVQTAKTTADTETIMIQTAHSEIIVIDKAAGVTLYVRGVVK